MARSGCDRRPAANTTVQFADTEILVRKQRAVIFEVAIMAIVKQASSTLRGILSAGRAKPQPRPCLISIAALRKPTSYHLMSDLDLSRCLDADNMALMVLSDYVSDRPSSTVGFTPLLP